MKYKKQYDYVGGFINGFARTKMNGKWGKSTVQLKLNKIIIPCDMEKVRCQRAILTSEKL